MVRACSPRRSALKGSGNILRQHTVTHSWSGARAARTGRGEPRGTGTRRRRIHGAKLYQVLFSPRRGAVGAPAPHRDAHLPLRHGGATGKPRPGSGTSHRAPSSGSAALVHPGRTRSPGVGTHRGKFPSSCPRACRCLTVSPQTTAVFEIIKALRAGR